MFRIKLLHSSAIFKNVTHFLKYFLRYVTKVTLKLFGSCGKKSLALRVIFEFLSIATPPFGNSVNP